MGKAIVTIVVGEAYTMLWREKAQPSWERFAHKHGYEIVLFDHLLDDSPVGRARSPSWQKLLVLGQSRVAAFERILWLDADVIINDAAAPCPIEQTPPDRVGVVIDQAIGQHPPLLAVLKKINNNFPGRPAELARYLFEGNRLPVAGEFLLNGGVLVLSPVHREMLENVYTTYEQGPLSYYEQVGLSYELLSRNLHHLLDPRFNQLWMERQVLMHPFSQFAGCKPICIAAALDDCFFLHFAGRTGDMAYYDPRLKVAAGGMEVPLDVVRGVAREWGKMADDLERNHATRSR